MGQVIMFAAEPPAFPSRTTSLDSAESTLLIAVRWWVAGYRGDEDPVPRLCDGLKIAGARDAAFSINSLMAIVARTARKAIAIHAPRCHCMSEDEQILMHAASLIQAGDIGAGERALRTTLLLDYGAEFALVPLAEVGVLFASAGLIFTRRQMPGEAPPSRVQGAPATVVPLIRTLH